MDERRGLQRPALPLVLHEVTGDAAEFIVDTGCKLLQGGSVALRPGS